MTAFYVTLGLFVGWVLASIRVVGPRELAVKLLLGKAIENVDSGPHIVPWGIYSLEKASRLVIQEQYPADPEKVWKGEEKDRPEGMFPPIRVTHKGDTGRGPDSLNHRMTTEVSIIVRYRIDDFLVFVRTIGSVDEVRRQIRDSVVAKVREELAKLTPAETLEKWDGINQGLKRHVEAMVCGWGITIEDVQLEEVDLGKTVNTSLRNVASAELDKQSRSTSAEARQIELEREGQGVARARQLLLEAEAKGSKAMAEELGISEGEVILALNILDNALKSGNQVVISGSNGLADLITMATAVTAAMKKG